MSSSSEEEQTASHVHLPAAKQGTELLLLQLSCIWIKVLTNKKDQNTHTSEVLTTLLKEGIMKVIKDPMRKRLKTRLCASSTAIF